MIDDRFKPTKGQIERIGLNNGLSNEVRERLDLKKSECVRRLTPVELERLNGFPDDHTEGVPDGRRAFFMGNALVCGLIEKIAFSISES